MECQKEFDQWNKVKKRTEAFSRRPRCKEGEIWWCRFGVNIGSEQDGKGPSYARPVLLLKRFTKKLYVVAPLTTSTKIHLHGVPLRNPKGETPYILLGQIRVIDTRRLGKYMETVDPCFFLYIRETARNLF